MITVQFINGFQKELTEQQVDLNGYYGKKVFEDGVYKYTHWFDRGKLTGGIVHLSSCSELAAAKSECLREDQEWGFQWTDSHSGPVKVVKEEFYKGYLLDEKHTYVYYDDKEIAMEVRDSEGAWVRTTKCYYDDEYGDTTYFDGILLMIDYYEDGYIQIVTECDPDSEYTVEQYLADEDFMSVFNWNDHPYYHAATPLIPEGDL